MDHYFCLLFGLSLLDSTFCFPVSNAVADVSVKVTEGKHCQLPCTGLKDVQLKSLEWTWIDRSKVLLVLRNRRVVDAYQHPYFTNRVELLDPQLHSGEFGVTLKNVTFEDKGIYECRALYYNKQDILQRIQLIVTEEQLETASIVINTKLTLGRTIGLVIVLLISILVVVVALSVLLEKQLKGKQSTSSSSALPDESAAFMNKELPSSLPPPGRNSLQGGRDPSSLYM